MTVNFTIHADVDKKLSNRISRVSDKTSRILAVQIQKDTDPFVPASQSEVLSRGTTVSENKVIYHGPYARFLYFGKLMIDPNTGSAWAKKGAAKVLTDKDLLFSKAVHPQAQPRWFEASKAQNLEKWLRVAEKAVRNEF